MDITLYCREQGAGEPLVLLHGNGENHTYFEAQIAFFSQYYRVLALDTRGHGRSPRGTAPFTLVQFARDLHDFLQQRGIRRVNLLGFSDGGNIALLFALRWPRQVDRLILNGANLEPRGMCLPVLAGTLLEYGAARLAGQGPRAELLGLMVKEPRLRRSTLARLHCRTLVIVGTRDMIARRHTLVIHRAIPGAELVLLPGDHFVAAKQPEAFNRAVWHFLQRSGG